MSANIQELLDFDPLATAGKVTGVDYKEDDETLRLGMGLFMMHNRHKAQALKDSGDTTFGTDLAETLEIYNLLGFEEVYQESFQGRSFSNEPAPTESFRILWHPDSAILAKVVSYSGTRTNTSDLFYNWRMNEGVDRWSVISSGHFNIPAYDAGDKVWIGHHDVREGLVHKIMRLRENGSFVAPWIERPFLWLLTYMDADVPGYDYEALNEQRISALPEHVQKAITPDVSV